MFQGTVRSAGVLKHCLILISALCCEMMAIGQAGKQDYRAADFEPGLMRPLSVSASIPVFYLIQCDEGIKTDAPDGFSICRRLNERQAIVVQLSEAIAPKTPCTLEPVEPGWKLSESLLRGLRQREVPRSVMIYCTDADALNNACGKELTKKRIASFGTNYFVYQGLTSEEFSVLLYQPSVWYIQSNERVARPELSVESLDLSANNILTAAGQWPEINGSGIRISIKEQQFDTNDIDFRGRHFRTSFSDANLNAHASIMATMAAGAGNSSVFSKGVAPGTVITGASFNRLLPEPETYYRNNGISIQNHSYGVGVESSYGADAAAYDQLVWTDTNIVHCFSAGNSGLLATTEGLFKNLAGWANLTGSFKHSKNTLALTATDSLGSIERLSSRGPAHDGRLKPELAAFGEDGTSGAAALASGAAALLQQFIKAKTGKAAAAALVKALLINGAADIGAPGPDYTSGYGTLDVQASMQMVADSGFRQAGVSSGTIWEQDLVVPADASMFSVTLCWTDTAGAPGSAEALQNNLDLELISPSGAIVLPWVLNSFPHPDSLALPAKRGLDSLNNVEQITLQLPAPGTYRLRVKGKKLLTSRQSFAVCWRMQRADDFVFTSPVAASTIDQAKGIMVRWKQSFSSLAGDLFLENLSTQTEERLGAQIDLDQAYFKWMPPATNGHTARLRMEVAGRSFYSDIFLVASRPALSVGFLCSDSVMLYWPKIPGAEAYNVYALGSTNLQLQQQLSDTQWLAANSSLPSDWLAVAPVIAGKSGPRSPSIKLSFQGVGCYIRTFFASYLDGGAAALSLEMSTLYGVQSVSFEEQEGGQFKSLILYNNPLQNKFQYTDSTLVSGSNFYRVRITLDNGRIIYSFVERVLHAGDSYFVLFPNPVQRGSTAYLLNRYDSVTTGELTDITGRYIKIFPLNDLVQALPTGNLPAGLYLLIIREGGRVIDRRKLLVQ